MCPIHSKHSLTLNVKLTEHDDGRDSWASASAGVVVSYASKDKSYLKQGGILSLGKKSFLKFDKEAISLFLFLLLVVTVKLLTGFLQVPSSW